MNTDNQETTAGQPERDANEDGYTSRKYAPEANDTQPGDSPVTASPGETPYTGSHADNYEPEQAPNRNVPDDGPSGENTKNGGERGGGLWTSGGQVTTGTPYHDEDEPKPKALSPSPKPIR